MAGKKGMGLGNMNASKHPHRTFMKRRVVPTKYRWVISPGENCMEKIQSDLPDMTGKEQLVAEAVQTSWTCMLLGLAEAKERGFIIALPDGGWDFQQGVKSAGIFLDRAIKGMIALGLERRAKQIGTLAERLDAIHGGKA
jgi:hypothetical protein